MRDVDDSCLSEGFALVQPLNHESLTGVAEASARRIRRTRNHGRVFRRRRIWPLTVFFGLAYLTWS